MRREEEIQMIAFVWRPNLEQKGSVMGVILVDQGLRFVFLVYD